MQLHPLDIAIIIVYLVSTVVIGFWVSKRASKNLDSYFLGGNTIPWVHVDICRDRECRACLHCQ